MLSAGRTGTTNFTAYVSPYLVVNNGGNYSKHIYIGSQRITSKMGNSGLFTTSSINTTDLQAKYATLTAKIKERFDSLGVTYKGTQQTGGLVSTNPSTATSSYFYHSDHLGSSSLITDPSGAIVQHLEYVPFGETFIDERRSQSTWNTPYLFSGKERDNETGLLYFGARYQDSKYGVWYSVDPLAEDFPNVSSYVYCLDNPVKLVDPDGNSPRGASYSTSILGWFIPPAKAKTPGQMMQKDGFHRKLGHAVLDGAGMVPLAGEVFDGLNGVIYGIEGNKIDAAFSLGACIPIVGWVSTGAKWAGTTFKAAWKVDARIVNQSFEKLLQKAPYDEAFNVFEGVTKNNEKFVRVHGEYNKFSKWMMKESDIKGLSPQQIKDKFALPELPSQISDVNVPAGTKIRVGVAKGIDGWGKGGGTQVELLNNIQSESFTNTRKL